MARIHRRDVCLQLEACSGKDLNLLHAALLERESETFNHSANCERGVDLRSGFFLHPGQHVRVGVESNADGRVAEPLRDDLWMNSTSQQHGGMSMPQIAESYARQIRVTNHIDEFLCHRLGMNGTAIDPAADKVVSVVVGAEFES